uniref:Uncharacterized protein n=1 Tax=Anguilla anguilla TaxID=7936 RepID=A0A0E9X897_ANGAN
MLFLVIQPHSEKLENMTSFIGNRSRSKLTCRRVHICGKQVLSDNKMAHQTVSTKNPSTLWGILSSL